MDFENGVKRYVWARAMVVTHFPVDFRDNAAVNCEQCEFYRPANRKCGLTGKISEYPSKYIGSECPLEFLEFIEEDKK